MRKDTFDINYFERIDTEHKAYWLGFLMADGCIIEMPLLRKNIKIPQTLQLSLSEKDIEVIDKFKQDLNINKKTYIAKSNKGGGNYCRIQVGSNKMCLDLCKLGCTPRKTTTLKFPKIEQDLLPHFIRGYFDGDGSVYYCERWQYEKKRDSTYLKKSFCASFQGTYEFLEDLGKVLLEQNVALRPIRKGHGEIYCLEFGARQSMVNFFHYLYDNSTICLSRKYKKFIDTFEHLNMKY